VKTRGCSGADHGAIGGASPSFAGGLAFFGGVMSSAGGYEGRLGWSGRTAELLSSHQTEGQGSATVRPPAGSPGRHPIIRARFAGSP